MKWNASVIPIVLPAVAFVSCRLVSTEQQPAAVPPAVVPPAVVREPSGYVLFDDVGLPIRPHHGPLVSTRRQTVDHIGLGVSDLRTTVARLKNEGVTVLEEIHGWGDTRAAMIEGPDQVALELVEAK
jgi:hypothetical protein